MRGALAARRSWRSPSLRRERLRRGAANWFFRYQPIDFNTIEGRGSEAQLKSLVHKAHSCKVKVIAAVVFNHMTLTGAFRQGGDLRSLRIANALDDSRSVTFGANHDTRRNSALLALAGATSACVRDTEFGNHDS
jgi:hypothetical protein